MSSSAVRASCDVVAEVRHGSTRCTTMRSSPPLTFRSTPDALYLVGSAAGPLGGDELQLRVRVEAGATLVVRSAASTMAMPGVTQSPSHLTLHIEVAAGATLHWLPEPLLLVTGCDHRVTTRVQLDPSAELVLRDRVVCGRYGEVSGSLLHRMRVDVGDEPLVRNDLQIGPRWPGADGPSGRAEARAVAQTLLVGARDGTAAAYDAAACPGGRRARMPLRAPFGREAVLISELSDRALSSLGSEGRRASLRQRTVG